MKIAIFTDSYLPVMNGVSIAVRALAKELQCLGHEVALFAPAFRGHTEDEPFIHRFPSLQLPIAYRYPFGMPASSKVAQIYNEFDPDIVHTHTPFFVGMVGRNWGRATGRPVVSTYHTLYEEYVHYVPLIPKGMLRSMLSWYLRRYYRKCDALITPSQTALESLRRHKVNQTVSIIPTGMPVPPVLDKHQMRQELGIAPNDLLLLYVGRIAPEKNLSLLIEAMKPVFEKFSTAKLWLVGSEGPYRMEGEQLAQKLGINERVRFVGAVPREEVNKYYAAADLFLFSSRTETQGLVIGEAQTFGLPCIAVEGGGASEAIQNGETGLVVPNGIQPFASAVMRLLENPALCEQFSRAGKNQWKDQTPADTACRVLDVYRSALSNKTS